jgi:phage head maturation protease
MGEDARGLKVRGQLNLATTRGSEAYKHIRAGDVGALSSDITSRPAARSELPMAPAFSRKFTFTKSR